MSKTNDLLRNYTKEKHTQALYSNFQRIEFNIIPISSQRWEDGNNLPYIATSYLLDSYSCLPYRPDMAFTFLWKSINNCYSRIGKRIILNSNAQNTRLTDKQGIDYLVDEIHKKRNDVISTNHTLINLINEYVKILPIKPFKFLANQILKGYVLEKANIANLLIGSTYSSFKRSYPLLYNKITESYGEAYRSICTPKIKNNEVDLGISDDYKSIKISDSLASKLKDLFIYKTTTIQNSDHSISYTLSISDNQLIALLVNPFLYSIRNNSVHGNSVSRLNSKYVNVDSLKTAINIYFLGHLFLSFGFYVNNEIDLSDLKINEENLSILKRINNTSYNV